MESRGLEHWKTAIGRYETGELNTGDKDNWKTENGELENSQQLEDRKHGIVTLENGQLEHRKRGIGTLETGDWNIGRQETRLVSSAPMSMTIVCLCLLADCSPAFSGVAGQPTGCCPFLAR